MALHYISQQCVYWHAAPVINCVQYNAQDVKTSQLSQGWYSLNTFRFLPLLLVSGQHHNHLPKFRIVLLYPFINV